MERKDGCWKQLKKGREEEEEEEEGTPCQVLEWWVGWGARLKRLEAELAGLEGGRRDLEVLEVASASDWRWILLPH